MFFLSQAQKNRGFKVYDEQMRLVAYSNGNGILHHANGEVFKTGDSFKPAPFSPTPKPPTPFI